MWLGRGWWCQLDDAFLLRSVRESRLNGYQLHYPCQKDAILPYLPHTSWGLGGIHTCTRWLLKDMLVVTVAFTDLHTTIALFVKLERGRKQNSAPLKSEPISDTHFICTTISVTSSSCYDSGIHARAKGIFFVHTNRKNCFSKLRYYSTEFRTKEQNKVT